MKLTPDLINDDLHDTAGPEIHLPDGMDECHKTPVFLVCYSCDGPVTPADILCPRCGTVTDALVMSEG